MDLILLLIINIFLYSILILIHFLFKHSFDRKLENYRTENTKTIDLFRDELFKKSRRFELKYDIFKGLAYYVPKVHWVITQFDWERFYKVYEDISYQVYLVRNFYGKEVQKKLEPLGKEAKEISERRTKINEELNKISVERFEIEQQKKYLNMIYSTEPKTYKEIFDRVTLEAKIEIKDKDNFIKQTSIIAELMKEIKSALEKIYPLFEQILTSMANELKEEYQL